MLAVYMVAMDIIAKYKIVAEGERLPPCGRERLPPLRKGKGSPPCGRGLGAICAVVVALSSRELLGYALGVEMWFFVWIRQKKWIELLTV